MSHPAGRIFKRACRLPFSIARRLAVLVVQVASLLRRRVFLDRKVIIFLVPGQESLTGGILSIFALYRFSQALAAIHQAGVLMCHYPGEGGRSFRYVKFNNDVIILPFELTLALCWRVKNMQLHVPEYAVQKVVEDIGPRRLAHLCSVHGLRLNILNQNIQLMPPDAFLEGLRRLLPDRLTCTTAHPRYSTVAFRRRWGMPVHHLPAWTAPDDAPATGYETKRDLMIVSPDASPHREAVLEKIAAELPRLEIRVITGLRFEQFLELARAAKWSLTFGEGMDDYFASVFFRGGAGFAVYNEEFFTPEFKGLRTVFPDWGALAAGITAEIKALDSQPALEAYNARVRPLLTRSWSAAKTRGALAAFYRGDYTFP